MTLEFFNRQMARLTGLKFRPADLTTHWEALQDLPELVLEAAVTRAQRTRVEFPTPAELRQDADLATKATSLQEPAEYRATDLLEPFTVTVPGAGTILSVTRQWRYYDERCSDTGWASWWCGSDDDKQRPPWVPVARCYRHGEHGSHEWVDRCACSDSNPALIRKRDAQRQYAEKPGRAA